MARRYKILVIGGGGIFGIVPATMMNGLKNLDHPLYNYVDVMGGTSIGGILSLMYAQGYTPEFTVLCFKRMVEKVFRRGFFHPRRWSPLGAKYSSADLQAVLRPLLDKELHQLDCRVVVPVLDFLHRQVKVFDNMGDGDDDGMPGWTVGVATSSAPTYFDPFDCVGTAFIDGGLLENIPIVTTCTAVHDKMGVDFKDMDVLAIGTGRIRKKVRKDPGCYRSWTIGHWMHPLVDMLTEANEMASVFWAGQLGLGDFRYFDPVVLEEGWDMDNWKLVDEVERRTGEWRGDFNKVFWDWMTSDQTPAEAGKEVR